MSFFTLKGKASLSISREINAQTSNSELQKPNKSSAKKVEAWAFPTFAPGRGQGLLRLAVVRHAAPSSRHTGGRGHTGRP